MKINPTKWYVIMCAYGEYYLSEDTIKNRSFFNTKAEAMSCVRWNRCSDAGAVKQWAGCYEFQGRDLVCTGESLIGQGFTF